jgi:hypothetical protein
VTAEALMVVCSDGPLEGASFTVTRCPKVVALVRSTLDSSTDILNEPDDAPRLDEEVFWYRWDGAHVGHVCMRGRGLGCYRIVHLVHAGNVRDLHAPVPVNAGVAAGDTEESSFE